MAFNERTRQHEWEVVPLDELVALQRGYDLPSGSRKAGEVPVVGSFGITGWHDTPRSAGPGVTLGRSGASIGVATYVVSPYWPLNTALYVKDFKGNNPRFIYYLLHSIDFSNYNSGSAQPSLNRNFIAAFGAYRPPRRQQDAIAEVLGTLDDKIACRRRMHSLSIDVLRTLYAALRANVDTWVAASEVAEVTVGGVWGADEADDDAIEVATLRGKDLENYLGLDAADVRIRWWKPQQYHKRTLQAGDVLTAGSGTLGPSLLMTDELVTRWTDRLSYSNFVKRLRPEEKRVGVPLWLELMDAWNRGAFDEWRTGTAMPNLDVKALLSGLQVPAFEEESLDRLWELAELTLSPSHLYEKQDLQELRDTLLPKLISGELRVPDAEKLLEDVV